MKIKVNYVLYNDASEEPKKIGTANKAISKHCLRINELAAKHFSGKWYVRQDSTLVGHAAVEAETGRVITTAANV